MDRKQDDLAQVGSRHQDEADAAGAEAHHRDRDPDHHRQDDVEQAVGDEAQRMRTQERQEARPPLRRRQTVQVLSFLRK